MKQSYLRVFLLLTLLAAALSFAVGARTVVLLEEDFEDSVHAFVQTPQNGSKATCTITDNGAGGKALLVTQQSSYAHVGAPILLKKDVAYTFSYDVKPVSLADGTAIPSGASVSTVANFLFADANSTNKQMNHTVDNTKLSSDGAWRTVTGSYTPKSGVIAADAALGDAWFCVYFNPTGGKNNMFLIDNVKVTYEDDEPLDGVNYFKNGSFEDTEAIEMKACNGTSPTLAAGDTDASDGVYSLRITAGNYGHIGIPMVLEAGRTYDYAYSVKVLSDNKGTPTATPVSVNTNFVFADSNCSNQQRNHVLPAGSAGGDLGWVRFSGSYTPDAAKIAADAALDAAWFTVYVNPVNSSGAVWLIDDVVLKRRPLESSEREVVLPDVLSDNMLVQMGEPIPVWGTFSAGEELTFTLTDGARTLSETTAVPQDGRFEAELPAVNAYHQKLSLIISAGSEELEVINNVAVGELWHFSGQSNMAAAPAGDQKDTLIPANDMPDIRYFNVGDGGKGAWKTAARANVYGMSAVAYKTMETIYLGLDGAAPVGGFNTSVGGKKMANYTGVGAGGDLYNARIKPLTAIPVKGHVWYQGESDTKTSDFTDQFEALITSWRGAWNNPDAPFLFVQLPQSAATIPDWWGALDAYGQPTRTSTYDYTAVRFRQNALYDKMKDTHVGMVVAFDTTTKIEEQKSVENKNAEDPLHPWNKAPIGLRLGNHALHTVYGKTGVRCLSPYPTAVRACGKYIAVTFDGAYDGLQTSDGLAPRFFEIIDADGAYHTPDSVTIAAPDTVLLYSADVAAPAGVAYAYENHFVDMSQAFEGMDVNLFNSETLPASPFVYTLTDSDKAAAFDDLFSPVHENIVSVRFNEPFGLRTRAYLPLWARSTSVEYGYIVARTSALGESELTFDVGCPIASGVAYRSDGSVDKLYALEDDRAYFTAVLIGITPERYGESFTVRPYLIYNNGTRDVTVYGEARRLSLREAAGALLAEAGETLSAEQKALLEEISKE